MKVKLPLYWRLWLLTLLIALPTFVLMYAVSRELRAEAALRAQDDALEMANRIAREQGRMIDETRILLTTIARWPQLQPETWTECRPFLTSLMAELSSAYRNIGIATLSGDVVCAVLMGDTPVNLADRDFFQRTLATQEFATSDYLIGRLSKVPVMGFSAPIFGANDDLVGLVTSTIDLSWLQDAVDTAALPAGTVVTVLDQDATVLARLPEVEGWVGQTLSPDHPLVRAILAEDGDGSREARGFDGTPSLVAFARMPGPIELAPVYVSVAIPSAVAYASINVMLQRNFLWMGLATLFMGLLAWAGGDLLIRSRVQTLVKAARQLATGDFSVRVGTDSPHDEIGALEEMFDQMAASLQQLTAERARAEHEIRRQQTLLQQVVDTIPSGLSILDTTGKIIYANPALHQLWSMIHCGGMENFSIYRAWYVDTGKPLAAGDWAAVRAIRDGESTLGEELEIERPDGTRRFVLSSVVPLRDDGVITGALMVNHDFTKRRETENALRASQERFRTAIESMLAGFALFAPVYHAGDRTGDRIVDFRLEYINEMGVRLNHRARTDRGPQLFSELFPADIAAGLFDDFVQVATAGRELIKDGYMVEEVLDTGVAVARAYDIRAAKLDDGFLLVWRDVTAHRRAQVELQLRAEELARSNAELEQFAYVASHDLQEPLRIVTGYLGLLQRRYISQLDQDANEFINFALEATERMQALIRDLLAYSRVSTRGQPLAPTAAADALAAALANLRVVLDESGATLEHEELPLVRADARQLTQLFQNLVGNALKFRSSTPPRIQVTAARVGDQVEFAVHDNGIGIEPEYAERIFVLFQRLHTREEYPGTGIGLAICKKIVERHGGQIWVESTLGQGATFHFTLPAADGGEASRAHAAEKGSLVYDTTLRRR